jgi:predicted Zn-dependent protease
MALPPDHTPAYGYADPVSGDVFHWPVSHLPVRYFADPRGAMRAYVQRAIGLWQDQFLYGEFRGVLVNDSTLADVIVLWGSTVPPDVPPDPGPPVRACDGFTTPNFDASGTALAAPAFHTELDVLAGSATPAQLAACMQRTVVHELGHTLGLWQEANDSLVIMNFTPWVSAPSDKDRRTIEYLYHVTPTIAPPPP